MNETVKIYADLIRKKIKSIDDVPSMIKGKVEEELKKPVTNSINLDNAQRARIAEWKVNNNENDK